MQANSFRSKGGQALTRTLGTLLVVAIVVGVVYTGLRALLPQVPQANAGILGAIIGLIAGGILRWQWSQSS